MFNNGTKLSGSVNKFAVILVSVSHQQQNKEQLQKVLRGFHCSQYFTHVNILLIFWSIGIVINVNIRVFCTKTWLTAVLSTGQFNIQQLQTKLKQVWLLITIPSTYTSTDHDSIVTKVSIYMYVKYTVCNISKLQTVIYCKILNTKRWQKHS